MFEECFFPSPHQCFHPSQVSLVAHIWKIWGLGASFQPQVCIPAVEQFPLCSPSPSHPYNGKRGVSSSQMPGFSVLLCGVGRVVNEYEGQGDLPRFRERGGGSKLMGEHASICARVCAYARIGTHVAAPYWGQARLSPVLHEWKGAWHSHCTGARRLKAGVPHWAWG